MSSLIIFPFLSLLSQGFVVWSAVYARKYLPPEMKILALNFIVALTIGLIQLLLAMKSMNNQWTFQYYPIQFVFLMSVFRVWNQRSFAGKFILYVVFSFVAAWIIGNILLGDMTKTLDYGDPIAAIILVVTSSYTLLRIDRLEGTSVLDIAAFWVSSATIIYFGGTIVLSSLNTSLLRASLSTMRLAWTTQSVVNIIANFLYVGGFLCLRRKT